MPKFKNITIKKKGGGKRTQRVQVLSSGKYKFVKNKTKTKRKTSTKKGQVRKTARRAYIKKKVKTRRKANKADSAWNF